MYKKFQFIDEITKFNFDEFILQEALFVSISSIEKEIVLF